MKRRFLVLGGMAIAVALIAPAGAGAATIFVTTDPDSGSFDDTGCGLREAVQAANDNAPFHDCNGDTAGTDTIVLQSGHTYELQNIGAVDDSNAAGDLDVTGPTMITTDGIGLATIVGNNLRPQAERDRVIQVFGTGSLAIDNLRIQAGRAQAASSPGGGGILSDGPLTITNSEITQNRIEGFRVVGGGIYVRGPLGTLTMTGTTVAGNNAIATGGATTQALGAGIGVYDAAPFAEITNSTISGNTSTGNANGPGLVGGAFLGDGTASNPASVTLTSNTITANNANTGGAVVGGIQLFNGTLSGNIIAGNTADNAPRDCLGFPDDSLGANILGVDDGGCSSSQLDDPTDLIGTPGSPVNPGLGALLPNGGPTRTHALNLGSVAINRGGSCPVTDQRGFFRAPVAPCDSGAFELNASFTDSAQVVSEEFLTAPPPPAGPIITGQRAAALKKCKKIKNKPKRIKCKRKANKLPL